ncbi:MAG TPA: hypothetical protein PLB62_04035, partial [Candidatus Sumerlaeota bacterium]|nr:hypothetical protein [Candidatus Sumerlaeota bacterium]
MISITSFILLASTLWAAQEPPAPMTGFGRFGRIHDDGLLTLNVKPWEFHSPPPMPPCIVRFADPATTVTVREISPVQKILDLSGGDENSAVSVRYNLLYPGLGISFGKKGVLDITRNSLRAEEPHVGYIGNSYWILLVPDVGPAVPLVLAFRENFKPNWELTKDGDVTRISLSSNRDIGEVRIITPLGMTAFDPNAGLDKWTELREQVRQWAHRGIIELKQRIVHYDRDNLTVTITEKFTGYGENIAPLSPVLAFALEQGYPASVNGEIVTPGWDTKYGPYAFVRGDVVCYTLPVPPLEERGYLRGPANQDRVQLLNDLVGHLPEDWRTNAVDLGYAGVANAQMAWTWLKPEVQIKITNTWKKYLPLAFKMPPYEPDYSRNTWQVETEPFTGGEYIWTYQLPGPPPELYRLDIDWGNALPLYGLYKYAQYSGDWDMVRAQWPAVKRIFRYFELGDDWAWMTVVNGDMGWSTGTGDPMTSVFGGYVACLKMARAIGDEEAEKVFATHAARIAVPALSRFWFREWARKRGFAAKDSIIQGFWEKETFTESIMDDTRRDPWGPTNILSGDGILPEFFTACTAWAAPALREYEDEYARYYPNWADGAHQYPFNCLYKGNSVYVTFPHIYARAVLGESGDTLWGYMEKAKTNFGNAAFVGPNVVAELLSTGAPIILTEWQPAGFLDGEYAADGLGARMSFRLAARSEWLLEARVRKGLKPVRVLLNGAEIPFEFRNELMMFKQTVEGAITIEISFAAS